MQEGRTALHKACEKGTGTVMINVLAKDDSLEVNARDAEGNTPLHVCAESGNSAIARLLIERLGANIHAENHVSGLNFFVVPRPLRSRCEERSHAVASGSGVW